MSFLVFRLHPLSRVTVLKAIQILAFSMLFFSFNGIAESNKHVINELLKDFRDDLIKFQAGLSNSAGKKNFSLDLLMFRRGILLLDALGTPDAKIETLKEFPDLDKALKQFVNGEASLKDLASKREFSVTDFKAIEKAILTTKNGKEFSSKGDLGKFAEVFQLETEKRLSPQKSINEILSEMALRKLAKMPKDILLGEGTPLLKRINEQLGIPTLGELAAALKLGKLPLTDQQLLELNALLVPLQVQLTGGLAGGDALEDLYRIFVAKQPAQIRTEAPDFSTFLNQFAATQPKPNPALSERLGDLGRIEPFRIPGNRNGTGISSGPSFLSNTDGRAAAVSFNPAEEVLSGVGLSAQEKACLSQGPKAPQNYEMRLSFKSRPGSISFCSSTPVARKPQEAQEEPTPSSTEGMCLVNFFTAKHCVEPGDLASLSIKGITEPISKAQILVETTGPSVTGGDDSAVIKVEMTCRAAKSLRYVEPASADEARIQLSGAQGSGIAIARNREINVELNGSPFLFARGYIPGHSSSFSGFAVTADSENRGQKVKQGDSGGYQVACINGTPKVIGATSTVLVNAPGQTGGRLGRAASLASLDWLGTVLKTGQNSTPSFAVNSGEKNRGATTDRVVHPSL